MTNPAHLHFTRTDDGAPRTAIATEIRPGVLEITTDLLRDLMRETGWTEVPREASR